MQQTLAQIVWLLMSHGAVSYDKLRAEFGLSEDDLNAACNELIFEKKCAVDRDGCELVWALAQPDAPKVLTPADDKIEQLPIQAPPQQQPATIAEVGATKILSDDIERRPLTVMFCDLADSTALSTRFDIEDLQEIIGQFRDGVTRIVERHAGYVARYMGDGVLVYFGYPKALERSAEQAIFCAIDILNFVETLRPTVDTAEDVSMAIRVGIETGPVVVGELIGQGGSLERAVVGEAPNLAARLQGLAERNQLIIGPMAYRAAHKKFRCHGLGAQTLKGFSKPVYAWAVDAGKGNHSIEGSSPQCEQELPVVFGRDTEIKAVSRHWTNASMRTIGTGVVIKGEAGIGKTLFVDRIAAQSSRDGAQILSFHFTPYHSNSTLYPVVRYLRSAADIEPKDSVEDRQRKLCALFQTQLDVHETQIQLLAILLGQGIDVDTLDISAEAQKQKTLRAFVDLVVVLAKQTSLLLVWEDVHWADPTSQELIGELGATIRSAAVLMILTTRPVVPIDTTLLSFPIIELRALKVKDARNLVAHVVQKKLPPEIVEHILSRSDDIPLFIEETTKTVLESSALKEGENEYALVQSIDALIPSVPETLQDSLIARLQSAPSLMNIAQAGSIFGREFSFDMIDAVSNLGAEKISAGLARMVEGQLVVLHEDDVDSTYVFKHALIRDAAYSSILRRNRKLLHLRAALFLQTHSPITVKENPEIIARHFSVAKDFENAVTYFVTAGKIEAKASANQEAVAHLSEALSLLLLMPQSTSRDVIELDIQNSLINPMIATRGHAVPETDATSRRAVELCKKLDNTDEIFPGLYGRWLVNYASARIDAAKEHAVDYLEVANSISGRVPKLVGHRLNGASSLFLGDPETARFHLMKALDLHDPAEDSISALSYSQDFGVSIYGDLGLANALLGEEGKAKEWSNLALTRAREIDHANSLAFTLHVLSVVGYTLADWDMVRELTQELEMVSTRHNVQVFHAGGRVMYGTILSRDGNAEEGLTFVENAMSVLEDVCFTVYGPISVASKAEALVGLGQIDQAIDVISQGLIKTKQTHERWYDAELYRRRGALLSLLKRDDDSRADFATAKAVAKSQNAKLFLERVQTEQT